MPEMLEVMRVTQPEPSTPRPLMKFTSNAPSVSARSFMRFTNIAS